MKSFIGKTVEAITLQTSKDLMASEMDGGCVPSYMEALTDNYLKLRLKGRYEENRWLNARVESLESGILIGVPSNGCDVEDRTESEGC